MDITANFTLILILISLLSPFGVPLGATFFIISAGSLSVTFPDYVFFVILVFSGFVIGDVATYATGAFFEKKMTEKFCNNERYMKKCKTTQDFFDKYGASSVFWTRFLLLGLAAPVNYISGFSKYSFRKFILSAASGELIYAAIYTYIGFIFKDSWVTLYEILSEFSLTIILLFAALYALYNLKKHLM